MASAAENVMEVDFIHEQETEMVSSQNDIQQPWSDDNNRTEEGDSAEIQDTYAEEDIYEDNEIGQDVRDFSQNSLNVQCSWSLMNQVKGMARSEGVTIEDLLIELISEGVTKRVFETQNRSLPSHLMTRNGYVTDDHTTHLPQPKMSHHTMANMNGNLLPSNGNGQRNNRFQQRNNSPNGNVNGNSRNGNTSFNRNNTNYNQKSPQNGGSSFRSQNGNNYNNGSRFQNRQQNQRQLDENQNINKTNNGFYNNKQRDNSKR